MATGILGRADLAAGVNTTLYTVPASTVGSVSVNFCNRNAFAVRVRLAVATSGTPTTADWVIYDAYIDANGVLEKTGLVLNTGAVVVVYASNSNTTAMVYGFEE